MSAAEDVKQDDLEPFNVDITKAAANQFSRTR